MKSAEETPQLQFLEMIDPLNGGRDYRGTEYCDIYLSDYNHKKVKKMKLSPTRWVKGVNLRLWPGSGSGKIIIGGEKFAVAYAWGGRNKPSWETTGDRTSYTVRLEGTGVRARILKVRDAILMDECGALKYEISFRKYQRDFGVKNLLQGVGQLRKSVQSINKNKELKASLGKLLNLRRMVTHFKKDWKANEPVVMSHQMKKIETDLI